MKTITYLLQVSACTAIFYAFYFMLLRRFTFFTLNRCYLLGTLLLSLVIPAIDITVDTTRSPVIMQPVFYVNHIQIAEEPVKIAYHKSQQTSEQTIDWIKLVKIVYLIVVFASVMRLLVALVVFTRRARNKELMKIGRIKVLKGSNKVGNSSFLNIIFVNDEELEPAELKQIVAHEMLHIKLRHSADRLLARLVVAVLWFNPFVYL